MIKIRHLRPVGRSRCERPVLPPKRPGMKDTLHRYRTELHEARQRVFDQPRFQQGIERLAADTHKDRVTVATEASGYLGEMVSVQQVDLVGRMMRLFDTRSFEGRIRYDQGEVARVRALMDQFPTAILPSHRSYTDPVVLGAVLRQNDMRHPFSVGGANMAFWPIGSLGRRAGGIFVRRSFRDNPVYKFVLREYIGYLAEQRASFEWYIEGGRSRTGKLRPPRLGLLAYVADAVLQGRCEDFVLVPVSIVYDELIDVEEYSRYATGSSKPRETLGWFARYIGSQRHLYGAGTIYVGFGEPLSLREAVASATSESAADGDDSLDLQKVAFEVAVRINRVTPITPTAVVALAMLGSDRALTLEQLCAAPSILLDDIRRRGLPVTSNVPLDSDESIRSAVGSLMRHGVVTSYDEGTETVYAIETQQRVAASYYRNSIIHFFLTGAIAELAVLAAAEPEIEDRVAAVYDEALRLRDVLKFEFFFPGKDEFCTDLRDQLRGHDETWEKRVAAGPEEIEAFVRSVRPLVSPVILRSFLDAYHIVADTLAALGDERVEDDRALVTRCGALARQYLLQRRIQGADSASSLLFETGIALAGNRGLLDSTDAGLAERRQAFAAELHDVIRRVEVIQGWSLEHFLAVVRQRRGTERTA